MRRYLTLTGLGLLLITAAIIFTQNSASKKEADPQPTTAAAQTPPSSPVNRPSNVPATPVTTHQSNASALVHHAISATPAAPVPAGGSSAVRKRAWDYNFLKSLSNQAVGANIRFDLVNGVQAEGTIRYIKHENGEITYITGNLTAPETGNFFFQKQTEAGNAGDFVGIVEFPTSKLAYRIEPTGPNGTAELVEHRLKDVVCMSLPVCTDTNATANIPPLNPSSYPTNLPIPSYQNGIVSLQSRPGAKAVIYLDFQGGYTPTWGGITYEKPNVSNSDIYYVWKIVSERYEPFQINITTDLGVFTNTTKVSRQRCLITPTTTAAPGAGGVSYMGSFQWGGTPDTPNWVFMTSGKSCAEAIAHECGHALGLSHDGKTDSSGNTTVEYYSGQGSGDTGWAPIMGVAYYQPIGEWCKGEYQNANNQQDDLAIIASNNNMQYRDDDTGDTLGTSRYLEIYTNNSVFGEGIIETTEDTDAFQFTTSGGRVYLKASTVGSWGGLALRVSIKDSSDVEIASNNPQTTTWASITTNLPAGTYTFCVTGAGRNDPLTTGFSSYASLGYYSISGTVANGRMSERFAIPENIPNGTVLGTISPLTNTSDTVSYSIAQGNESGTFQIDDAGHLSIADNTLLDYEALATNTQLTVQLELFVDIVDLTDEALSDYGRRVVVSVTNVNEAPIITGFTNSIIEHSLAGAYIGNVIGSDPDFGTLLHFSIVGGNDDSKFSINSESGAIYVAGDLDASVQNSYVLQVAAADQTNFSALWSTTAVSIVVIPNQSPFHPGGVAYTVYTNIGGNLVSALTSSTMFPYDPAYEKLLSEADAPTDQGDSYGAVMRGYLIPPATANYVFYIATDDNGELWLSSSTNPASMTRRAYISGNGSAAGYQQWTRYATQRSAKIALTAGQAYYFEARMKEGSGDDYFSVGWTCPNAGINTTNVIPGCYLAPYSLNYKPHVTGFTNYLHRDAIQNAIVGNLAMTDVNSNDNHVFSLTSGNSSGAFSIDEKGNIRVADESIISAGATTIYRLVAQVVDDGTPARANIAQVGFNLVNPDALTTTNIYQEIWTNIGSGESVANLIGNAAYPKRPNVLRAITDFTSGSANYGDKYGSRIRAWVTPPSTGSYRFFIASDDGGVLKYTATTNPVSASTIAYAASATGYGKWTASSSQRSVALSLNSGQKYYLEALQKEGGGDDYVEVGWAGGSLSGTNIIAQSYLTPVDLSYAPVVSITSYSLTQLTTNGTTASKVTYSSSPLETITFKIVSGNSNNTFAIDCDTGIVTVNDATWIQKFTVPSFDLVVQVQNSGYGDLFPRKSTYVTLSLPISELPALVWNGNGTNDNWSSIANWNNASLVDNSPLDFAGLNRQTNFNDAFSIVGQITLETNGYHLTGNALTLRNGINNTGSSTFAIPATLNGSQAFVSTAGTLVLATNMDLGANLLTLDGSGDFEVRGVIQGTGGIAKTGTGTLVLDSAQAFTGPLNIASGTVKLGAAPSSVSQITVSNGATLDSSKQVLIIPEGQILSGCGTVLGDAVVHGTLAPGNVGTPLLFSNTLALAGTTVVEISKETNGSILSDKINVSGALTLGGTLAVTCINPHALTVGDVFDLFDAATTSGNFVTFNLPSLDAGLMWDTSSLMSNGTLRVEKLSVAPQIQDVAFQNGSLTLKVQTTVGVYYVFETTLNLSQPVVWTPLSTNVGTGEVMIFSTPTTNETQQYYRINCR